MPAARVGTNTRNIDASYKCRRKTLTRLPCGGWVSLSNADGNTRVTHGVMGHDHYYSNVPGHPRERVPAPRAEPLPEERATIELDASGHGHSDVSTRDAQGFEQRRASYDVVLDADGVTVDFASTLHPDSCNSYDETCTFRVPAVHFLNCELHAILHDVRGGMHFAPGGTVSSSFSQSARQPSSAVAVVFGAAPHLPSGAAGAFGVAGVADADAEVSGALDDDVAGADDGSFAGAELPPQAARRIAEVTKRTLRMSPL